MNQDTVCEWHGQGMKDPDRVRGLALGQGKRIGSRTGQAQSLHLINFATVL